MRNENELGKYPETRVIASTPQGVKVFSAGTNIIFTLRCFYRSYNYAYIQLMKMTAENLYESLLDFVSASGGDRSEAALGNLHATIVTEIRQWEEGVEYISDFEIEFEKNGAIRVYFNGIGYLRFSRIDALSYGNLRYYLNYMMHCIGDHVVTNPATRAVIDRYCRKRILEWCNFNAD